MDPMSRSLISRWFRPQKVEYMPGYAVKKRAADNMLKSSVPEPQDLAPKSNCELAPLSGRSSNSVACAGPRCGRDPRRSSIFSELAGWPGYSLIDLAREACWASECILNGSFGS